MNSFDETIALRTKAVARPIEVSRPRVLLLTPGGRSYQRLIARAQALIAGLRYDGWQVRHKSGDRSERRGKTARSDFGLVACRLDCLQETVRLLPRFDVLHILADSAGSFWSFVVPALILGKFFGRKIVLSFLHPSAEDFLNRWDWLALPFFRLADRLVVDCTFLSKVLARHGLKAVTVSTPVEAAGLTFRRVGQLQPKILSDRPLEPAGNLPCLLKAFKLVKQKYPRAELIIAGNGSMRRDLQRMVAEEHLNGVTLRPHLSSAEAEMLYAEADLFVNPSSQDTLPQSILTACLVGLPVVTTDAGGIADLVKDRVNGMVVSVNSHTGLSDRIIELIEQPELVATLAERARSEAERFQWANLGASWRRLYREAASS